MCHYKQFCYSEINFCAVSTILGTVEKFMRKYIKELVIIQKFNFKSCHQLTTVIENISVLISITLYFLIYVPRSGKNINLHRDHLKKYRHVPCPRLTLWLTLSS